MKVCYDVIGLLLYKFYYDIITLVKTKTRKCKILFNLVFMVFLCLGITAGRRNLKSRKLHNVTLALYLMVF